MNVKVVFQITSLVTHHLTYWDIVHQINAGSGLNEEPALTVQNYSNKPTFLLYSPLKTQKQEILTLAQSRDSHIFSCFSMIQALWLMESSAAVLERGDVTGHIMQPLHLQYINGQAKSLRWSPSLFGWSTFTQKSVEDLNWQKQHHFVHNLFIHTSTRQALVSFNIIWGTINH